jgi:acetyl-CoA carboxylase biotin carboxyl carrier protein
VELKDIKAIIDLMKKNSISEFELERTDFKIRLKRGGVIGPIPGGDESVVGSPVPNLLPALASSAAPQILNAVSAAPAVVSNELDVKSPMVGTFYRSPSPDSAPYVEVGSEVNPDTVVCLVEAMKVMNEIKAEVRGVITQVLADNAKPIEFGQVLFKVRPS